MTRDEEIKNMFPRRKEINDSMPLMSFGKSYTVNDSFEVGYVYGAQWADSHPSAETIKMVAEQILMFNHITPDCWSQWMADGCVEQIKKNLER